ncbi:sulfotransferase [Psychrosphaera aquimarina]|uniref:Sulfotransferase n=1 Tax=Psychrosphaera aquimarina TaxID=2044854 RepID=A0ABU3QZ38_9GAMM|nr:sulfotransferase [Psychrosphaera aquimarina]MDU0112544.1 sulfotransferase [Psychrosphaera aquimarina]
MAVQNEILSVDNLLDSGWQNLRLQKMELALDIAQTLSKHYPEHAEACFFNGQVSAQLQELTSAKFYFEKACHLAPHIHQWQFALLNILLANSQKTDALRVLNNLAGLQQLSARELNKLGLLYSQLNKPELAVQQYKRAITLDPNNHEHHYSLATVLRHCGDLIQAEAALLKATELNPNDVEAVCLLVDLSKQTLEFNQIAPLNALLAKPLTPRQSVQIHFALAKTYEDLEQYPQAFALLETGAKIRRQHLQYDVKQDVDVLSAISESFDENWWLKGVKQQSKMDIKQVTPIFILGMPRTGSTLLERVLSAEPSVYSAGELSDFTRLLTEQVNLQFGDKVRSKRQFIECCKDINFQTLGDKYIHSIKQYIPVDSQGIRYVIDKLPFNYLYIGLIKKALPNAKIIHVTRDPMDTCYAVYKTLFQQAYPFSYDQVELAEYYVAYQRLMSHWQSLPDLSMLDVAYEDLVQTPQQIGEQVFEFCQLTWQDRYTQVQDNRSAINTASSSQVRQAIHKNSIAKWRKYQTQLSPLQAKLVSAGFTCD